MLHTNKTRTMQDGDCLVVVRRSRAELKAIEKAAKEKEAAQKKSQEGWNDKLRMQWSKMGETTSQGVVAEGKVGWEPDIVG
eukprot:SAG11_NODE_34451_length_272_cov_0.549133_1_plen_80_part_10